LKVEAAVGVAQGNTKRYTDRNSRTEVYTVDIDIEDIEDIVDTENGNNCCNNCYNRRNNPVVELALGGGIAALPYTHPGTLRQV
jgi:hypothetical protein